jgi:uncharacterized iron-regulated protein
MNLTNAAQTSEPNFRIFDAKGNPATISEIISKIEKNDAVFLGENHDDSIAHELQMEIFRQVFENYAKNRKIVLSLEMFERDVQIVLDEYLKDLITENHFLQSSRPWNNYKTDYRSLVEFAKQNQLSVVAANAPRRYINMVSRGGREALGNLSPEAKKWLAPLPFASASPEYSKKFNALMSGMSGDPHSISKFLESQTLWDATMAFAVAKQLKNNKNALIIHLNGSFHTENRLGTVEHLQKYQPNARILVVTMRYENDFKSFDKTKHENLGDFVILTERKK